MKSVTKVDVRQKQSCCQTATKSTAQCCAKSTKLVMGCHD